MYETVARRRDIQEAFNFYKRACEIGSPVGCFSIATMLAKGGAVEQDLPQAARVYGTACDGGDHRACNNLGVMLVRGDGVTMDVARGIQLIKKASDDGNSKAFTNVGALLASDLVKAGGGNMNMRLEVCTRRDPEPTLEGSQR